VPDHDGVANSVGVDEDVESRHGDVGAGVDQAASNRAKHGENLSVGQVQGVGSELHANLRLSFSGRRAL
jgi:hypothetical protein